MPALLTLTIYDDGGEPVAEAAVPHRPATGEVVTVPSGAIDQRRRYFADLSEADGRRWSYHVVAIEAAGPHWAALTLQVAKGGGRPAPARKRRTS
jgi:hypothetical protein